MCNVHIKPNNLHLHMLPLLQNTKYALPVGTVEMWSITINRNVTTNSINYYIKFKAVILYHYHLWIYVDLYVFEIVCNLCVHRTYLSFVIWVLNC